MGRKEEISVDGLPGLGIKITFLFLRKGEREFLSIVSLTNLIIRGLSGGYSALTSWYEIPESPGAEPL